MIVMLEGPDGSGKSRLANELEVMLSEKGHMVERDGEKMISTNPNTFCRMTKSMIIDKMIEMTRSSVIYLCDRGPISDCIYRLFDDYDPVFKIQEFFSLWNSLITIGPNVLIYCNSENAEKNMRIRGDDNRIAIENHSIISKAYKLWMQGLIHNKHDYDYDKQSANEILAIIEYMYLYGDGGRYDKQAIMHQV